MINWVKKNKYSMKCWKIKLIENNESLNELAFKKNTLIVKVIQG
jgi:hypothetical protein